MDSLTTEIVATPTDSGGSYNDNFHTINDLFMLHLGFVLIVIALIFHNLIRKMYVNLIGGRKGE